MRDLLGRLDRLICDMLDQCRGDREHERREKRDDTQPAFNRTGCGNAFQMRQGWAFAHMLKLTRSAAFMEGAMSRADRKNTIKTVSYALSAAHFVVFA